MKHLGFTMAEMAARTTTDAERVGLGRAPRGTGQEPTPQWVSEIACLDPIAAYGMVLGIPRVPISFNAAGNFPTTLALGAIPIEAGLDTTIAQRTWIDNITYDIQLPNLFVGSVFKAQSDAFLRQSPGISIRLTVHSGPRYLVSPNFTPLDNFVSTFTERWPRGWPLFKQQNIDVEYQLTQLPIGSTSGPYIVTLTFNGWQFLDHTVDEISVDVAARKLRELGFWVPRAVECP